MRARVNIASPVQQYLSLSREDKADGSLDRANVQRLIVDVEDEHRFAKVGK